MIDKEKYMEEGRRRKKKEKFLEKTSFNFQANFSLFSPALYLIGVIVYQSAKREERRYINYIKEQKTKKKKKKMRKTRK